MTPSPLSPTTTSLTRARNSSRIPNHHSVREQDRQSEAQEALGEVGRGKNKSNCSANQNISHIQLSRTHEKSRSSFLNISCNIFNNFYVHTRTHMFNKRTQIQRFFNNMAQ